MNTVTLIAQYYILYYIFYYTHKHCTSDHSGSFVTTDFYTRFRIFHADPLGSRALGWLLGAMAPTPPATTGGALGTISGPWCHYHDSARCDTSPRGFASDQRAQRMTSAQRGYIFIYLHLEELLQGVAGIKWSVIKVVRNPYQEDCGCPSADDNSVGRETVNFL